MHLQDSGSEAGEEPSVCLVFGSLMLIYVKSIFNYVKSYFCKKEKKNLKLTKNIEALIQVLTLEIK